MVMLVLCKTASISGADMFDAVRGLIVAVGLLLPFAHWDGNARAQGIYPEAELRRDTPRLETAVTKIYRLGIRPALTSSERAALAGVRFAFPMPQEGDETLNFYAGRIDGQPTVVFPILSLKMVEDLVTAFAWLYEEKRGFGPIDLYFAMLNRKPFDGWGKGGRPDILRALGVPKNVLKNKRIDRLSLSLRNEAYAFIITHELGHLLFRHQGIDHITPLQARADEIESDAFALDILARTGTAPLGMVVYFQAQIFALPHRGEFKSRDAWRNYLRTASTHPLSVERITAMGRMVSGPLARRRSKERRLWRDIGARLLGLVKVLDDVEIHNCMVRVAEQAPPSQLRAPDRAERGAIRKFCLG